MKKIISSLLTAALCMSFSAVSFAEGINFKDVKKGDWFYDDVKATVEMGLINGKDADSYAPDDNLTYAEAIKLAACMNQLYKNGKVTLTSGDPWYQPFVDYCISNNIIKKEYNPNEKATRAGYMEIFANSLPDEALGAINKIPDNSIGDVPSSSAYASAVYKLYRAGILAGIDDKHNCGPEVFISRKEVASILARMMNENKRVSFEIVANEEATQPDETEGIYTDGWIVGEAAIEFGISSMSKDVTVACGEKATFGISAIGGKSPYTYQWQYSENSEWKNFEDTDDGKVSGAKECFIDIETTEEGITEIRCIIADSDGKSVESKTVKLTVEKKNTEEKTEEKPVEKDEIVETPDTEKKDEESSTGTDNKIDTTPIATANLSIKTQPKNTSVLKGSQATFNVEVTGGKTPYSYQWQVLSGEKWNNLETLPALSGRSAPYSGEKTPQLKITLSGSEPISVRCVIKDGNGKSVVSSTAVLTVKELQRVPSLKRQ